MQADAQQGFGWLKQLAGEWTLETEAEGPPGEPPIRDTGTEHVRALEGVWVLCEAKWTQQDGSPATSITSIGYDAEKGRFMGTFLSSMMTYLWIYEGIMDDAGVLSLDCEGPSYTDEPGMAKYRDTIQMVSDDHRVHTSSYQRADGSWHQFMTTHYRRVR